MSKNDADGAFYNGDEVTKKRYVLHYEIIDTHVRQIAFNANNPKEAREKGHKKILFEFGDNVPNFFERKIVLTKVKQDE